ncbi:hypothetical protein BXU10_04465 [Flavobacterium sp. LM4]|nr:hypothetical protein BXU10_04465 [Flavobacterium sp. LM4]
MQNRQSIAFDCGATFGDFSLRRNDIKQENAFNPYNLKKNFAETHSSAPLQTFSLYYFDLVNQ